MYLFAVKVPTKVFHDLFKIELTNSVGFDDDEDDSEDYYHHFSVKG